MYMPHRTAHNKGEDMITKIRVQKSMDELKKEFIDRLLRANDENVTADAHMVRTLELASWKDGVLDTTGLFFNGDHYYIPLIDEKKMDDRPMCCGVFLDWKSKIDEEG
jgi:hypothetical protein